MDDKSKFKEYMNEDIDDQEKSPDHDDMDFDGTTSKSTWTKIRKTVDRVLHDTFEAASDVSQRGKIELEIAAIRLRLRSQYSKLGEAVFRLSEGEEVSNPVDSVEVQDMFMEVRETLADLANERRKLDKLRESDHWTGSA